MADQRAWIILETPEGLGGITYTNGWVTIRVRPEFVQMWEYDNAAQPAATEVKGVETNG